MELDKKTLSPHWRPWMSVPRVFFNRADLSNQLVEDAFAVESVEVYQTWQLPSIPVCFMWGTWLCQDWSGSWKEAMAGPHSLFPI